MKPENSCCGTYSRKKVARPDLVMPPNPEVINGVQVIYVGAGYVKIKGIATDSLYHASDHHRHFKVWQEDLPGILKNKTVILKP